MQIDYTPDDEAFRDEIHCWLATHYPPFRARWSDPLAHRSLEFRRAWEDHLCAQGWSGLSWPAMVGGKDWPLTRQAIFHEEYASAGAPLGVNMIGHGILGPTLIHFGNTMQKQRYLPRILDNSELWCQGYSEPGAGSDLAALRTRALRDGDHYVVNGHKIWTSFAHIADWCFVLVRTDPDAAKHRGISFLLIDMRSEGIRTAPIGQITGESDFNEVFFENVRVPVENRVGAENEGWRIAMTAASFERGTYFIPRQIRLAREIDRVIEHARSAMIGGEPALDLADIRRRIARLRADSHSLRLLTLRALTQAMRGGPPGAEGSSTKLCWSEAHQRLLELEMLVLGERGALGPDEAIAAESSTAADENDLVREFLWTRAETILAGTSEIQRNIIAERVLGLPRG